MFFLWYQHTVEYSKHYSETRVRNIFVPAKSMGKFLLMSTPTHLLVSLFFLFLRQNLF